MSDSSPQSNALAPNTIRSLAEHAKLRIWQAFKSPPVRHSTQVLLVVALFAGPAMGQTDLGSVYCGTAIEDGIGLVFGSIIALGLPAAMFFVGRSGLSYMRSTGNPQQQNAARKDLILSGLGFMIVVLAIVSPEIIANVSGQLGFSFSDCVKPYTF